MINNNLGASNPRQVGWWYKQFTTPDRPYYQENKEILQCPVIHSILNVTTTNGRTTGMNSKLNHDKKEKILILKLLE